MNDLRHLCCAHRCPNLVETMDLFCAPHRAMLSDADRAELAELRENHPGTEKLKVAVAGCMAVIAKWEGTT